MIYTSALGDVVHDMETLMPLSSVITRFPAKSRSNSEGANAANEANEALPLLPELAGIVTCTILFCVVLVVPI